jgi:hypothetical protein
MRLIMEVPALEGDGVSTRPRWRSKTTSVLREDRAQKPPPRKGVCDASEKDIVDLATSDPDVWSNVAKNAPSGIVKILDELLDLPHLDILFRLLLTHLETR